MSKKLEKIAKIMAELEDKSSHLHYENLKLWIARVVYDELKSQKIKRKDFAKRLNMCNKDIREIIYADKDLTCLEMVQIMFELGYKINLNLEKVKND